MQHPRSRKCAACKLTLAAKQNVRLPCCAQAYFHITCAYKQQECTKCGAAITGALKKAMRESWNARFNGEYETWKHKEQQQAPRREAARCQVQAIINETIAPFLVPDGLDRPLYK